MYTTAKKTKTTNNNWCRIHSAKADREITRTTVCPSKLSKLELEDLYYRVLDTNIDLKKTVNEQRDKIKVLSTKVLRMTATQRRSISKEQRECCTAAKSIINEQNNHIAELKATITRKNEKINSQQAVLCSTKQFLAKSNVVSQCTLHSAWTNSPYSTKHHISAGSVSVTSARSEAKIRKTLSQSELTEPVKACVDNKCSTLKAELRQKIENLQQELSNRQASYEGRLSDLEAQVGRLKSENGRERADRNIIEESYRESERERRRMREEMSIYEARCCDLKTQLVVEQKKLSELEMQLKSCALSGELARTIQHHLANRKKQLESSIQVQHMQLPVSEPPPPPRNPPPPRTTPRDLRNNDDSGFTDPDLDYKGGTKMNSDVMKRITDLQTELDDLKSNAAKDSKNSSKSSGFESNDLEVPDSNENTPKKDKRPVEQCRDQDTDKLDRQAANNTANPLSEDVHESTNEAYVKQTTANFKVQYTVIESSEKPSLESNSISKKQEIPRSTTKNSSIRYENTVISKGSKRCKRKKSKQRGNKHQDAARKDVKANESHEIEENIPAEDLEISEKHQSKTEANPEPLKDKPSPLNTYTIGSIKNIEQERPPSPDDTEYEISSIAETPRNLEPSPLSPGERKFSSTCTTSFSSFTGVDSSCLSEGEVPRRTGKVLSIGEKPVPNALNKRDNAESKPSKVNMQEAIQSISRELARCRQLLGATRHPRDQVKRVPSVS